MKILRVALRIIAFIGAMYLWLLFTYNTLDRGVVAQEATGGGYLPNKLSFLILSAIIFLFLAKSILSKKFSFGSIASKIIFILSFLLGLYIFIIAI